MWNGTLFMNCPEICAFAFDVETLDIEVDVSHSLRFGATNFHGASAALVSEKSTRKPRLVITLYATINKNAVRAAN